MSLSKIMVVIDPTQDDQPAFERALVSACMTGARLHIYTCLNQSADETMIARYQARLETLIQRAEADGIEAITELEHAEDWSQKISQAAARCSASMIFKNSFEHSDVQREQRSTSDWTLLRLAPCPVLMVKNHRDWQHRRVLAAINSQSTDIAHIKLNNQIIGFAQRFTDAYGSDAHFINAYQDRNHPPGVSELSQVCGAPEEQIHVIEGAAAAAVSDTANDLGVDLVIIGTVGRTGLKGQVVGNTAERILDHTLADVLVLN
jgi:universal stress protein E